MANRLLFLLLLLLFLTLTTKAHSIDQARDDLDEDTKPENQEDSSEEIVSELAGAVGATEGLDEEVNNLIGIHGDGHVKHNVDLSNLHTVLENNRRWSRSKIR